MSIKKASLLEETYHTFLKAFIPLLYHSNMKNTSEKVAKSNEKSSDNRVRNWTAVLYPESLPTDWKDRLSRSGIKAVVSPLHDKDVNADGTMKKEHYHLILSYDGKKSYKSVSDFLEQFNCSVPQKIESVKGLVRYFTHMDNPEKAQYSRDDILSFNGFDVSSCFTLTSSSRYEVIGEMVLFCTENKIKEYSTILEYARNFKKDTWFPLLCDSASYVISSLIKSIRHGAEQGTSEYEMLMKQLGNDKSATEVIINEETGEVITSEEDDMNVLPVEQEKSE